MYFENQKGKNKEIIPKQLNLIPNKYNEFFEIISLQK